MPKPTRGGRGKGGTLPAPTPTPAPVAKPKRPSSYGNLTPKQVQALVDVENDDTNYDPSVVAARKMYISNTNFDGQGHSASQAMNYQLSRGADFHKDTPSSLGMSANDFATLQYMDDYLQRGMHTLGADAVLYRGAHVDSLAQFGIASTRGYTEAQLKRMLVGQHGSSNAYMSASYDVTKNPFLGSGSGVSGGREVVYEIRAHSGVQCILGARAQSELILNKNQGFTIKDVKFTGNTATPRLGSAMPQVRITIEMD